MRLLLLHLSSSFHRPNPPRLFFSAARSTTPPFHLKLAAAAPFSALRWNLPKVDLRSAFLAFSAGNGGSGGSDDASGDGKGDDGDGDETGSNLAASSWSPPEAGNKEEAAALLFTVSKVLRTLYRIYNLTSSPQTDDVFDPFLWIFIWPLMLLFTTIFSQFIACVVCIALLCCLSMGILAAAFCVFLYLHFSRQWTHNSEQIAANPPADTECCICLSTREGTAVWRSLPCNHWFHSPCINSWIRINPTCPICKGDALRRT